MAKYIIEGGTPLKGQIQILGAKNVGFKLMLSALLSDEASIISNVANNSNISWVSEAINNLGGKIEVVDAHTRSISGKGVSSEVLSNENFVSRASSMFLPILLHRIGKAKVPVPTGDKIGHRPIDRHIEGLKSMGAKVKLDGNFVEAETSGKLNGTSYRFEKNTHTGTETLILAACLANGSTVLENASIEPEVDDLISFLNKMGAKIKRKSTRTIEIEGVTGLNGAKHNVMPDRNEAVTFGCIALATKGDATVLSAEQKDLEPFIDKVKEARGGVELGKDKIRFFHEEDILATSIDTAPHPGFMTDWQPLWSTLMTQATGESVIHETVFESRFAYVENLKRMGANIEFFSPKVENPENFYIFNWNKEAAQKPHAVKIQGPTKLYGKNLPVFDIRAGATLVLAALTAQGRSVLENVEHIERGYENFEGRLESLGAKIKRAP